MEPHPNLGLYFLSGGLPRGPDCLSGSPYDLQQAMCFLAAVYLLNHAQLFSIPWTVVHQTPLSEELFQ